jgi:hypothetical protein
MVNSVNRSKTLSITDWPLYMWTVSLIYLSLAIWALIKVKQTPK